jgi:hypothetical protein
MECQITPVNSIPAKNRFEQDWQGINILPELIFPAITKAYWPIGKQKYGFSPHRFSAFGTESVDPTPIQDGHWCSIGTETSTNPQLQESKSTYLQLTSWDNSLRTHPFCILCEC